jgi:WD40 repeat protein
MAILRYRTTTLLFLISLTLPALAQTPSTFAPPVSAATFTHDGAAVLLGSQAGLTVHAWTSLEPRRTLKTKLPSVNALRFSPDGKTLAVAGGYPAEGGMIELFSWPEGELIHRADIHKDLVYAVAWRPDSQQLVTASADGLCHVFDATTHKKNQTFNGHSGPVLGITFTHDGQSVVSGGQDQTLRLWYAKSGELRRSLHNHTNTVRDLGFQPPHEDRSRPYLASAGADKTVRFWQPQIGRMVRFAKLPSPALALAWRPAGDRVLVSAEDGAVYLVDPDTVEVTELARPFDAWGYTLAVHPAGDELLAGGRNGKTRRLPIQLTPPTQP